MRETINPIIMMNFRKTTILTVNNSKPIFENSEKYQKKIMLACEPVLNLKKEPDDIRKVRNTEELKLIRKSLIFEWTF